MSIYNLFVQHHFCELSPLEPNFNSQMKRTLLTLTWEGFYRLWNVTMLVFANTSTCDLSKGDGRATLQYMIRYKNRVHL